MEKFNIDNVVSEEVDMKKYIDELVKELRNDNDVYNEIKKLNLTVGEVRENVAKLSDFMDDYNYCKKCPGINECNKKIPHTAINIRKEGNFITSDVEPCKKIIEQLKFDSHYVIKDFEPNWRTSSLRNIDLSDNRRPAIKEFSKVLNDKSERWIYLLGNHKVGKSYLAVTFANEYIRVKNGKVAVMNCAERIEQLVSLAKSDKTIFDKQIDILIDLPLLVMDNFGAEYKNEYIRDQIIIPLLSTRANKSKVTIFTSEFTIEEIQKMYSVGKNGGEIRGKQLGNILRESCESEFDLTGVSVYKK